LFVTVTGSRGLEWKKNRLSKTYHKDKTVISNHRVAINSIGGSVIGVARLRTTTLWARDPVTIELDGICSRPGNSGIGVWDFELEGV